MPGDSSLIYPVTGVQGSGICERKEIDEFVKNPYSYALLYRAFQLCQKTPKESTLSYWQLAGIHGLPFDETWPVDGGPEAKDVPDQEGRGFYCYHSGALFMTWHRPYVALVEQYLHDIMNKKLVNKDDEDYMLSNVTDPAEIAKYQEAAKTFRLPYWDFALRRSNNHVAGKDYCSLPDIAIDDIGTQQVAPGGVTPGIPGQGNPFFSFRFEGGSGLPDAGGLPVSIQGGTVRHAPNPNIDLEAWKKGTSNINSLKAFFKVQTTAWRGNLVSMLVDNSTYDGFTFGGGATKAPNLNNIHGNVHINTGGYPGSVGNVLGNMTSVPSAGFDPIFFFWHSMVDRLAAMWQAGHPDAWMSSAQDQVNLLPFRSTAEQVKFWNSAGCRDVTKLGYTYPELAIIKDVATLKQVAQNLYVDKPKPRGGGGSRAPVPLNPGVPNIILTAQYETNEVGPFSIDILYGTSEKHMLGTLVNFVTPQTEGCGNCKQNQDLHHTVTSTLLLAPRLEELYDEGVVEDLENVEQTLPDQISWTCKSLSLHDAGRDIPESEFKSLKIIVAKTVQGGRSREGGQLPDATIPLTGITDGKPFGLREGEEFRYD